MQARTTAESPSANAVDGVDGVDAADADASVAQAVTARLPVVGSSTARARRVAPIEHAKYRNIQAEREMEPVSGKASRPGLLARFRTRADRNVVESVVVAPTAASARPAVPPARVVSTMQPESTAEVRPAEPPQPAKTVNAVRPAKPPQPANAVQPAKQLQPAAHVEAARPDAAVQRATAPHLVIPPAAQPKPSSPVWHDDVHPADLRSIGGRWLLPLIAISAVVMIALASGVLIFLHGRDDASPVLAPTVATTTVATGPIATAAEAWLRGNATSNERVLTDSAYVVALQRAGLALRVTSYAADAKSPGGSIASSYDYLLSTPDLRNTAAQVDPRLASALQSAIPIAYFGSQPNQLQVLRVSGLTAAQIAGRRSKDVLARKMAGQSLLDNPALTYSPATSAILGAGDLDLRPATVLAQLCSATPVEITAITSTPAETAAGMPVRKLRIRPTEPNELAPALNGMPSQFRPDSIIRLTDGSSTLTWSPLPFPQLVS
jgi:hypothetical protein